MKNILKENMYRFGTKNLEKPNLVSEANDNELVLPKAYAYKGHIVMVDRATNKTYHYELYVDKMVDISVEIVSINISQKEITYIHPLKKTQLVADLKDSDIAKIARQYKTTDVGDSIEGMQTKNGDELYLKRIM
jgi:hypothetical protein